MAIDNWTRFPLIDPQTDLKCGKSLGNLPSIIIPGTSEMVIFEKGVSPILLFSKRSYDQ